MMLETLLGPDWPGVEGTRAAADPGRRAFLKTAAVAALGVGLCGPGIAGAALQKERKLFLHHRHTGEELRLVYWAPDEGYLRFALDELSHLLRDHHNGEVMPCDPKLLDLMQALQLQFGDRRPIEILSGYRSPATNAKLRRRRRGVAKNSLHMEGMAADLRVPGEGLSHLRRAARAMRAGGVGYYPRSGFIHVDTGPVRYWRG